MFVSFLFLFLSSISWCAADSWTHNYSRDYLSPGHRIILQPPPQPPSFFSSGQFSIQTYQSKIYHEPIFFYTQPTVVPAHRQLSAQERAENEDCDLKSQCSRAVCNMQSSVRSQVAKNRLLFPFSPEHWTHDPDNWDGVSHMREINFHPYAVYQLDTQNISPLAVAQDVAAKQYTVFHRKPSLRFIANQKADFCAIFDPQANRVLYVIKGYDTYCSYNFENEQAFEAEKYAIIDLKNQNFCRATFNSFSPEMRDDLDAELQSLDALPTSWDEEKLHDVLSTSTRLSPYTYPHDSFRYSCRSRYVIAKYGLNPRHISALIAERITQNCAIPLAGSKNFLCVDLSEDFLAILLPAEQKIITIFPCRSKSLRDPPTHSPDDVRPMLYATRIVSHEELLPAQTETPEVCLGKTYLHISLHDENCAAHKAVEFIDHTPQSTNLTHPQILAYALKERYYCMKIKQDMNYANELAECRQKFNNIPDKIRQQIICQSESADLASTAKALANLSGETDRYAAYFRGYFFLPQPIYQMLVLQLAPSLIVNQIAAAVAAGSLVPLVGIPAFSTVVVQVRLLAIVNLTTSIVHGLLTVADTFLGLSPTPTHNDPAELYKSVTIPQGTDTSMFRLSPQKEKNIPLSGPGLGQSDSTVSLPSKTGFGGAVSKFPGADEFSKYNAPNRHSDTSIIDLPSPNKSKFFDKILRKPLNFLKNKLSSPFIKKALILGGSTIGGTIVTAIIDHYATKTYHYLRPIVDDLLHGTSEVGMYCSQVSGFSPDNTIAFIRENSPNKEEIISQAKKLKSLILNIDTRSINRDMTPISFENVEQTRDKLMHFINGSHKLGHDHGLDKIFPGKNWEQIKAVVREIIEGGKDCLPKNGHSAKYAYINNIPVLVRYIVNDLKQYEISGFFIAKASHITKYFPSGGIK
ncbi:hypothetical protein FJ366_01760 [Candidatus Dependentiae bacterium]|nr:hypothetical protein [Candidatus Dependentiae bacterium]